jgi:hypothetical protein
MASFTANAIDERVTIFLNLSRLDNVKIGSPTKVLASGNEV